MDTFCWGMSSVLFKGRLVSLASLVQCHNRLCDFEIFGQSLVLLASNEIEFFAYKEQNNGYFLLGNEFSIIQKPPGFSSFISPVLQPIMWFCKFLANHWVPWRIGWPNWNAHNWSWFKKMSKIQSKSGNAFDQICSARQTDRNAFTDYTDNKCHLDARRSNT